MSSFAITPVMKITKKLEIYKYLPDEVFYLELFPFWTFEILASELLPTTCFMDTSLLTFEAEVCSGTLDTFCFTPETLVGDKDPPFDVSYGLLPKIDFLPSGDYLPDDSFGFFLLSHP